MQISVSFNEEKLSNLALFCLQCSVVKDRDAAMSAKVNMEALSKEPDRTPSSLSSSDAVLICGSDGVARKARPQPHTTTALLLPGERTTN